MKTIPVRSPQMEEEKKEDSSLSVGVRIDERGPLVRIIVVGSTFTVRMKGLRHEFLRGHVQCMYRSTSLPSGGSIVTQASLLENLHRLDTMLVKKVAKKSRDTLSEMMVDISLGVSVPFHHAGDFTGKHNSLHAFVFKREFKLAGEGGARQKPPKLDAEDQEETVDVARNVFMHLDTATCKRILRWVMKQSAKVYVRLELISTKLPIVKDLIV